MKQIIVLAILLFSGIAGHSQPAPSRGEFATNSNGLMYSDADMKSLRFIVDSLNLRFKTCDLSKKFYSLPQAPLYFISFKSATNNLQEIVTTLKSNPTFQELSTRYKKFISMVDTNQLIIRGNNGKDEKEKYYYLEGTPSDGYESSYLEEKMDENKDISGKWVYEYSEKDKKDKEDYYYLECRFFPLSFNRQTIPDAYSQLIQYVDCMIDTSSVVFLTEKYSGGWFRTEDSNAYNNLAELSEYINSKMNPVKTTKEIRVLSEDQISFATNNLSCDEIYKGVLGKTINDYAANNSFSFQLESLAGKAGMFDKELLMKRCYRVMGNCSQDESPRLHARDIAILAGKSHSWDIFLRAHLDIMNDRFDRMTDGSYAWGGRKTYLKELEELDLNIVDLMLGLTLRAENVADNHYYGTIWRMGWALTESKEKNVFEKKAIAMMKDDLLDEFNRGLIFLLYHTYINYLDEKEGKQKRDALRKTINSFPGFIQASIQEMKDPDPKNK